MRIRSERAYQSVSLGSTSILAFYLTIQVFGVHLNTAPVQSLMVVVNFLYSLILFTPSAEEIAVRLMVPDGSYTLSASFYSEKLILKRIRIWYSRISTQCANGRI